MSAITIALIIGFITLAARPLLAQPLESPPQSAVQSSATIFLHQFWNLESEHAYFVFTASPQHRNWTIDSAVKPQYDDIEKYQTPAGVMSLMQ